MHYNIIYIYLYFTIIYIKKTITKNESLDFQMAIYLFIVLNIDSPVPLWVSIARVLRGIAWK